MRHVSQPELAVVGTTIELERFEPLLDFREALQDAIRPAKAKKVPGPEEIRLEMLQVDRAARRCADIPVPLRSLQSDSVISEVIK